jgi:hypothetical protein
MSDDELKQRVADYAMATMNEALESLRISGGDQITFIQLRVGGADTIDRVMNYPTAAEALAVARELIREQKGQAEYYGIAFLASLTGGKYDFTHEACDDLRAAAASGRQPVLMVEAGSNAVGPTDALAMGLTIDFDGDEMVWPSRPTHFAGFVNWLKS